MSLLLVGSFVLSPVPCSLAARHWLACELVQRDFFPAAKTVYRTLVWSEDALAKNNLGVLINLEARQMPPSLERTVGMDEAYELYVRAYQGGLPAGAYNAGMMDFSADSDTRGYRLGKYYLGAAAALGDTSAQIAYAQHLSIFVPDDLEIKRTVLRPLAETGNTVAFLEWADLLSFEGEMAPSDLAFRRAAATGDFFAVEALAYHLWNGPDNAGWLEVALQAAAMGSVSDQSRLGEGYKHGYYGLPVDPEKAVYWLEMAATLSNQRLADPLTPLFARDGFLSRQVRYWPSAPHNVQVGASYELAELYLSGEGVPKDVNRARELLREPAERSWGDARQLLADIDGADP